MAARVPQRPRYFYPDPKDLDFPEEVWDGKPEHYGRGIPIVVGKDRRGARIVFWSQGHKGCPYCERSLTSTRPLKPYTITERVNNPFREFVHYNAFGRKQPTKVQVVRAGLYCSRRAVA